MKSFSTSLEGAMTAAACASRKSRSRPAAPKRPTAAQGHGPRDNSKAGLRGFGFDTQHVHHCRRVAGECFADGFVQIGSGRVQFNRHFGHQILHPRNGGKNRATGLFVVLRVPTRAAII